MRRLSGPKSSAAATLSPLPGVCTASQAIAMGAPSSMPEQVSDPPACCSSQGTLGGRVGRVRHGTGSPTGSAAAVLVPGSAATQSAPAVSAVGDLGSELAALRAARHEYACAVLEQDNIRTSLLRSLNEQLVGGRGSTQSLCSGTQPLRQLLEAADWGLHSSHTCAACPQANATCPHIPLHPQARPASCSTPPVVPEAWAVQHSGCESAPLDGRHTKPVRPRGCCSDGGSRVQCSSRHRGPGAQPEEGGCGRTASGPRACSHGDGPPHGHLSQRLSKAMRQLHF